MESNRGMIGRNLAECRFGRATHTEFAVEKQCFLTADDVTCEAALARRSHFAAAVTVNLPLEPAEGQTVRSMWTRHSCRVAARRSWSLVVLLDIAEPTHHSPGEN